MKIQRRGIISVGAVILAASASWVIWLHQGSTVVSHTTVSNGEVRLYGRISEDTCHPSGSAGIAIGDVGCAIVVNSYEIEVQVGNIAPPKHPGTVTGLDLSRDQTGSKAEVYAKRIDQHDASIWDNPKYYVHILN